MSQEEADRAGIQELARLSYVRVDKVKGNNAPAEHATWRRLVNVELWNGEAKGALRAHFYDLGPKQGFKLVGIERPS